MSTFLGACIKTVPNLHQWFLTAISHKAFAPTEVQNSCTLTADGLALAMTMNNPAMSEFDIHIFEPFIM